MLTDVKVFKFLNGEVVLGQIISRNTDNSFTVKNPVTIGLHQSPSGGVQVSAQPWPDLISENDKTVNVYADKLVVSPYEPLEKLYNMYNEQFGSGLVLPSKGKLEF